MNFSTPSAPNTCTHTHKLTGDKPADRVVRDALEHNVAEVEAKSDGELVSECEVPNLLPDGEAARHMVDVEARLEDLLDGQVA